jgi:hypothetical protein
MMRLSNRGARRWRLLPVLGLAIALTSAVGSAAGDTTTPKTAIFNLIADGSHQYSGTGPWPEVKAFRWTEKIRIGLRHLDEQNPARQAIDTYIRSILNQLNKVIGTGFPGVETLSFPDQSNVLLFVGDDVDAAIQEAALRRTNAWTKTMEFVAAAVKEQPIVTCVHITGDRRDGTIVTGFIFVSTAVRPEMQKACISAALVDIAGLKGDADIEQSLKSCHFQCRQLSPLDIDALKVVYDHPTGSQGNLSESIDEFLSQK